MGAISGSGASLGTLWIEINAKIDQAMQSLQKFGQETGKLIDEQKQKWDKLADVGQSMMGVGASLTAALTLPLAGVGVAAVKAAGDFESSLNKITAVSGTTGAELDQLRQQAMQLGADTKYSAQEAAEGMGNLAAAGLNTNQIMAAMPGVLDLAAAGELEVARAAEVTTDTLSQFGLGADQAGKVADVFAKGAAASSISVAQMAESMKYAGPIAKSAGMSIEETATAVALLGNAGIKGEQAGTSLRGMISSLVSPSKAAAEALDSLGVKTTDAAGKMLPLDNIFKQLQASGASTADMFEIFDNASASAAATLTGVAGPAWASMTTEINNSQGAAKTMADTLNTGMKGAFEQMKGSVDTVMIALGQALLPTITKLIQVGTDFINNFILPAVKWFSELPAPVQAFAGTFAVLAAAIGPIILGLGGIATAIGTLMPALTGIATFFGTTVVALGGWALAIAAVVSALVGLGVWIYKNWDQITVTFLTQVLKMEKALKSFYQMIPGTANLIKNLDANIKEWSADVDNATKRLAANAKASADMAAKQEQLKKEVTQSSDAAKALAVNMGNLAGSTGKVGKETEETGKKAKETGDQFKVLHQRSALLDAMAAQLQSNYNKLAKEVAAAKLAAADMTRQTELLLPPTQALTDLVGRSNTEFKNLSKVHVPEAIQALGNAKTSTENLTNAAGGLDAGLKKAGTTSKDEYQKVSDNAKTSLDSMKGSWESFGTEVSTIVTNFTQSIAKSLFDGDTSWGEKAKGMLKSLGEAVTSSFIQPATKALTDFMNGVIKDLLGGNGLGGIKDRIDDIGKGITGIFDKTGDAAVPGAPAGGAPAGGGAGGGIGGLAGAVNMISGIATAVSSIVGNFQMMGMNKSLDIIVKHTLQTANDLANLRADEWSRFEGSAYSIMGRMGELLTELRIIQPDVSLARMSIQAIEANIGAGQATLEAMLNLDRETSAQQKSLTQMMVDRLDRLAMRFDQMLALTEKSITMNLYGTDPELVQSKIAGNARLQGVLA